MIIQRPYTIDFFDVDRHRNMTFKAMAKAFQGLATTHSAQVGAGYAVLSKKGLVWFLHRLKIEVAAFPVLLQDVRLMTWSRGFKGFKGFREYRIESAAGEALVKGSSVWLFYNFKKRRISKVPAEISRCYEFNTQRNFETELDDWQPRLEFDPDTGMDISLRYSDFDMNGHVNNTEYIGFLESLFHGADHPGLSDIKSLKIRFDREIGREKDRIRVEWQRRKNRCYCRVCDDGSRFAGAELVLSGNAKGVSGKSGVQG